MRILILMMMVLMSPQLLAVEKSNGNSNVGNGNKGVGVGNSGSGNQGNDGNQGNAGGGIPGPTVPTPAPTPSPEPTPTPAPNPTPVVTEEEHTCLSSGHYVECIYDDGNGSYVAVFRASTHRKIAQKTIAMSYDKTANKFTFTCDASMPAEVRPKICD